MQSVKTTQLVDDIFDGNARIIDIVPSGIILAFNEAFISNSGIKKFARETDTKFVGMAIVKGENYVYFYKETTKMDGFDA